MLLSKGCEYGLRSAIYVASQPGDGYVSIGRISEDLGISFHFLTKVLQQLTLAGIMTSARGPSGGVRLAMPADEVTLKQIVVALDGPEMFTECIMGLPGCGSKKPCPLHEKWATERDVIDEMLTVLTLAETARQLESDGHRIGVHKR